MLICCQDILVLFNIFGCYKSGGCKLPYTNEILAYLGKVSEIEEIAKAKITEIDINSKMDGIPIVFIHWGDSFYLRYALMQARLSNPNSPVFLLGDHTNSHYGLSKFYDNRQFSNWQADLFTKSYVHLSQNTVVIELACFIRWFILKEFMKSQGFQKCVVSDSDVLAFCDVTEEQKMFSKYDFVYNGTSPHFSFVNNLSFLDKFCEFMLDMYIDETNRNSLISRYNKVIENNIVNGICDMTMLLMYSERNPGVIGDSREAKDTCYDHRFGYTDILGFEMTKDVEVIPYLNSDGSINEYGIDCEYKSILFIGRKPYGLVKATYERIPFSILHFQGLHKPLMQNFFLNSNLHIDYYSKIHSYKISEEETQLMNEGENFASVGDFDNAVTIFNRIIKKNPGSAQAYNNMGVICFRKRDYNEAQQMFINAKEADPEFIPAYTNLGDLYLSCNDIKKAEESISSAYYINPGNFSTLIHYVELLVKLLQFDTAVSLLIKYKLRFPENKEIGVILEKLSGLKDKAH